MMSRSKQLLHVNASFRQCRRNLSYISALEEFPVASKTQPKAAAAYSPKTLTLSNGIKVVSKDRSSPVVKLTFSVAAGSAHETAESRGAAHLLASAAFSGTAEKSGLRLVRDLENLGAVFSASANRETVDVSVKVLADKLEQAFGVVSEVLTSAPRGKYVVDEVKDEQEAVAYETFKSNPTKQLQELLHEAAYGESSFGASVFADSLSQVSSVNTLNYRKNSFKAGNVTISADGASTESVSALAESLLKGLPAGNSTLAPAAYVGGEAKVRSDLGGLTYSGVAFPVGGAADAVVNAAVVNALTVAGAKFTPFYVQYSDKGLVGFTASGSVSEVAAALTNGLEVLKGVAAGSVNAEGAAKKANLEAAVARDSGSFVDSPAASGDKVKAAVSKLLSSKPSYAVLGKTQGSLSYASLK